MSILHYTIGLPPERRGGSVQYANDLMFEQLKQGFEVIALICGDTLFREKKCKIIRKGNKNSIEVYQLTNPLTPTLIYGVSNPISQHRKVQIDRNGIRKFIIKNNIKVLHMHTFMGIHKDIVSIFKEEGVKVIYTTHDFHGICLRCNLITLGNELCSSPSLEKCICCNVRQPSDLFLRLANSNLYHFLKKIGIFKILNKPKVKKVKESNLYGKVFQNISESERIQFKELMEYYRNYFSLIDQFHFNSNQTKKLFEKFLPGISGETIEVITSGIADRRKELSVNSEIKFGFIGNTNSYKGFPILKKIVLELQRENVSNFCVKVFGSSETHIDSDSSLIEYYPPYEYDELTEILYNIDCLIVPSKWYETFSLVTLEAISHGCPVIVSDHVGAKDIVKKYNPSFIYSTPEELKLLIKRILRSPLMLREYNSKILSEEWKYSIKRHAMQMVEFYNIEF